MKTILLQPNYQQQRKTKYWGIDPPLGLCYIATVLDNEGFDVDIIDANAENILVEDLIPKIIDCDVLGISVMTPAVMYVKKLIKALNENNFKGRIVCGGHHSSGDPKDMLDIGADVVIKGDGEYKMLKLCNKVPLVDIEGIFYYDEGKLKSNPDKPLDPNDLPIPDRSFLISNGTNFPYLSTAVVRYPWGAIFTSRGCPYHYYYCNKQVFGNAFRARTPENVLEEIDDLVKNYNIKELDIFDDSFNINMKRAKTILRMIIERKYKFYIRFPNGIRANLVDEEFMQLLKEAKCIYVAFGCESGNQDVLDKIGKSLRIDQVKKAVKLAKKYGIPTGIFFIFGLKGDTKETMEQTQELAHELNPDFAIFNLLTPYMGTQIYDYIMNTGGKLIIDKEELYKYYHTSGKQIFVHKEFPKPEDTEPIFAASYKRFYLRKEYIFQSIKTSVVQTFRMKSFAYIKMTLRGLYKLFSSY